MDRFTIKSSTILISVGESISTYRSMRDIPPPLRKRLEESTAGNNAATILIADKKGREELVRAVRGLPSGLGRAKTNLRRKTENRERSIRWNTWLELVLPGVVGLLIWLAFTAR